jgi:hypothetical protein
MFYNPLNKLVSIQLGIAVTEQLSGLFLSRDYFISLSGDKKSYKPFWNFKKFIYLCNPNFEKRK